MGNLEIFVPGEEVPELKKNVFYIKDLYGMEVFEKSAVIGVISNVLMIASKAMLIIKLPNNRELAVPFNDKYIGEVDIKNRILNALNLEELL
jgi:16S rRNA processing protein RimM